MAALKLGPHLVADALRKEGRAAGLREVLAEMRAELALVKASVVAATDVIERAALQLRADVWISAIQLAEALK